MADIFVNLSGRIDAQKLLDSYMIAPQYKLTYYCGGLGSGESFLVIGCGGSSYFFPIQFLGSQEIILPIELSGVVNCKLTGDANISGLTLSTHNPGLTQADNDTLQLVRDNSGFWDKVKDITNEVGKVRTDMLNGLINMTVNAFANESGTITQKDGIMTWMNGETPESSTQVVQVCGGAIRIANSKDANGNWVYKTAINGAGISTDAIVAGKISGLEIESGKITGTNITGGSITGVGITGATIVSGTVESGNYTLIDAKGNIWGYKNGVLMMGIDVQNQDTPLVTLKGPDGAYIMIGPNWFDGRTQFGINCQGGDLMITSTGFVHISGTDHVEFNGDVRFYGNIYDRQGRVIWGE